MKGCYSCWKPHMQALSCRKGKVRIRSHNGRPVFQGGLEPFSLNHFVRVQQQNNAYPNTCLNVVSNKLSSFNRSLGNLSHHGCGLFQSWTPHCDIRLCTLWLYPNHTLLCSLLSDWLYLGLCPWSRRRDNCVLPDVSYSYNCSRFYPIELTI